MKKEKQGIGLVKKALQPAPDTFHHSFFGLPIRTPLSVVGVAVVSMGLYACGGDGDGSAPPPPPVEPSRTLVHVTVEKAPESVLAKAAKSLARATALPIGLTQQYVATGLYSDKSTADVTATTAWSSSDEAVATVVAGAATAQLQGETLISACQEEVCSAPVSLTVDDSVVTKLTITAPQDEIRAGARVQFEAKVLLSDQRELNVTDDPALSWVTDNDFLGPNMVGVNAGFYNEAEYQPAPGRFFSGKNPDNTADVTVRVNGQFSGGNFNSEFVISVVPLKVEDIVYTTNSLDFENVCPPGLRLMTGQEMVIFFNKAKQQASGFAQDVCDVYGWSLNQRCGGKSDIYKTGDYDYLFDMKKGLFVKIFGVEDGRGYMHCMSE